MRAASPIFNLLLQEPNPAAEDALCAALTCASPGTSQAIVRTLMARNQPSGLYGLVEQFHHLDQAARQLVLDDGDRVFRALREAFGSKNDRARMNVLDLIRQARLYRAAYLLEAGLHDRQPRVREVAAESLHVLADTLLTSEPKPPEPDCVPESLEQQQVLMGDLESRREDRRQLASALAAGLACFNSHLQPKVVESAMWLVDDIGARFWTCITTPSSRALRAAVSILEQSGHPRLVAFSLEALAHSELRPHVLRILANRCEPEFLNEWLCQGWRLAEPRLARTMAAVKELACVEDRAAALLQLPAEAERHLGRWIRLTGLPSETRSFVIKELYRRGGSDLRRSALWALIESCDERSLSLLRVIASERDTDSSRMARIELARRFPNQYAPRDLLPEASVTTSAPTPQAAEPPLTLERYWNEFDQLDEPERLRLGSLILARTPRAWAVLNRQLSNPETTSRVRAVKMVTTLGLSASFSDQLYTLSFDHEPEVRSAAVLALGKVPNPTSKRILQQALGDPDDRVQANAVEAGEEGGQLGVDALLPKLASTDNRVRANAVKALLKLGVREAAETLVRMLRDPDRRQRASALWLVEKLGLFALTGRIVLMADGDQDPNLRRRAASIRDRLLNPSAQPAEVGP